MELRQNWHKFQRVLGHLPPKKAGLLALHSNLRIVSGAIGQPKGSLPHGGFNELGVQFESLDAAWEVLAHRYGVSGATFLDHEQLGNALAQVAEIRQGSPATDHFHTQLEKIREMLGVDRGEKSKLATHFGDKPVDQYWPRRNFLFGLFKSILGEFFPERKLFLLGVVDESGDFDALLLEFHGNELRGFCEPDFSGLNWQGMDLFLSESIAKLVGWCETHHMLPAYSLFLTRRVWDECCDMQAASGEKAAWRHLLKIKAQRDVEKEILFEPNPWPLRALIRWHTMRR